MKKFFTLILAIIFIELTTNATTLTGGVEISTQQAQNEVLSSSIIPDITITKNNLCDKNMKENYISLLNGKTELKDRILGKFSDGSYAVIYNDNPTNVFYYSKEGKLTHHEVKSSTTYPYKTYKYTPQGKLVNMTYRVSQNETFTFSPSGKLLAHWLGENCYNENNQIIMTRKIYK
jgi:hypothetical protein